MFGYLGSLRKEYSALVPNAHHDGQCLGTHTI
jgi:hypothetical protein